MTWTAKTDYSVQYNNTDFKIRVKADDSESANRYGYGSSSVFTLDTTNPVAGAHPILIDGTGTTNNVTLSVTDDTALQMKVGLATDLSDVSWEDYSASKTITLAENPETVYVQFKDAYGNTTSIYSVETPETPSALMVQDTSNMDADPEEYRLFIAWQEITAPTPGFASYKIYRETSSSGPWTNLIRTETDMAINYYGDDSVEFDTDYYYKVVTIDSDGNISQYSATINGKANGTQDAGEGGGGTSGASPTISNVASSSVSTTQATITWDTDEVSNSTVGYSTTSGIFTDEVGVATMKDNAAGVGQHQVVLTGLSPATTYYFQAISSDSDNNKTTDDEDGSGYSFTTLSGPAISNVDTPSISENEATITWNTTTVSNSYVFYSTNSDLSNAIQIGSDDSATSHEVNLNGLTTGATYYFYVQSGISVDNNGTLYYSFLTQATSDTTDPEISNVGFELIDNASAVISWTTDEASDSQVIYGTTSGTENLTSSTTLNSNLNLDHFATIINLVPDTRYYYQVISNDASNNEAVSSEYYFDTDADPEFQHDALSEISDITTPIVTDTKAVVSFDTDQPALCIVESGTVSEDLQDVSKEDGYDEDLNFNNHHSIHITGLIFSTKYYYQITCRDNLDNSPASSAEREFTTEADGSGTEGDTTAPEISSVSTGSITGESVTITWKTDEDTNSLVRYGITNGELTNIAGDGLIAITTDYDTAHTVVINNLTPGTKYYYTVFSYDAAGNIGESSESSFTTKSPSTLSSIKVVSTSLSEATITWTTSKSLTSIVEYGLTEEYGEAKSSNTATDTHEVALSGLKTGVAYHFRVKGKDADNNYYSSGDYAFEPKSPPKISSSSIDSVTEHGAKIVVITDIPTDILATYADTRDSSNTGSQGKPDFVTRHELELGNLDSGTTYSYAIKITDEQGNQTTSEEKTFTTGKDENPPEIIQVKTDSALAQNDKVQSIISWSTSEPATTSFVYKEGLSGEEKEIIVSEAYSQNHIVVSTIFKTGTVYHFKVKSVDQSGNETISSDFALLTPKKKENIVQIIVTNFQDIFGWAGVIGK